MSKLEAGILIFTCIIGFIIGAITSYLFNRWKKEHGFTYNKTLFQNFFDKYESKHNPKYMKNSSNNDIVYDYLEEEHKKLVNEKSYDSTSFDEEELEEDDYYNEDLD